MSSSSWSEWSELEGRGEGGGNPEASPWRAEGTHLFDVDVPLPPYALTCYVPLNDLTPENGHSCPHYSPPLPLSPPPRSIIHCLAPRGSPCRSPPLRSLPSTPSPPLLPPAPLSGPAEFARGSHVPGREYRGGERPKGGLGADGGAASAASFGMLRPLGTEGLSVGEVIDHLKQADGGAGIVEALIDAAGRGEARRPPPLAALPVAAAHQQVADDWEALVASVAQAPDWQGQPLTWSESADRVREVRPTNGLRLRQHFCLSTLPPDTASSSCRLFATFTIVAIHRQVLRQCASPSAATVQRRSTLLARAGDAVVVDYRLWRRWLPNRSDADQQLLYAVVGRPWWGEKRGTGEGPESLFEALSAHMTVAVGDDPVPADGIAREELLRRRVPLASLVAGAGPAAGFAVGTGGQRAAGRGSAAERKAQRRRSKSKR